MKLRDRIRDALDWIANDWAITVGKFTADVFTIVASLYYAMTNALPILPQWVWGAIFGFMVIASVTDLEDLVYYGLDDEDEDELDEEDDEIVED